MQRRSSVKESSLKKESTYEIVVQESDERDIETASNDNPRMDQTEVDTGNLFSGLEKPKSDTEESTYSPKFRHLELADVLLDEEVQDCDCKTNLEIIQLAN